MTSVPPVHRRRLTTAWYPVRLNKSSLLLVPPPRRALQPQTKMPLIRGPDRRTLALPIPLLRPPRSMRGKARMARKGKGPPPRRMDLGNLGKPQQHLGLLTSSNMTTPLTKAGHQGTPRRQRTRKHSSLRQPNPFTALQQKSSLVYAMNCERALRRSNPRITILLPSPPRLRS